MKIVIIGDGKVGYKLAKQQTKKLPFVNKKLTTQKILNLYSNYKKHYHNSE